MCFVYKIFWQLHANDNVLITWHVLVDGDDVSTIVPGGTGGWQLIWVRLKSLQRGKIKLVLKQTCGPCPRPQFGTRKKQHDVQELSYLANCFRGLLWIRRQYFAGTYSVLRDFKARNVSLGIIAKIQFLNSLLTSVLYEIHIECTEGNGFESEVD